VSVHMDPVAGQVPTKRSSDHDPIKARSDDIVRRTYILDFRSDVVE
jgi:hypothetical protein